MSNLTACVMCKRQYTENLTATGGDLLCPDCQGESAGEQLEALRRERDEWRQKHAALECTLSYVQAERDVLERTAARLAQERDAFLGADPDAWIVEDEARLIGAGRGGADAAIIWQKRRGSTMRPVYFGQGPTDR